MERCRAAVGALDSYDESLRASKQMRELYEVRNMRQVFDKGFFMGGALASMIVRSPRAVLRTGASRAHQKTLRHR